MRTTPLLALSLTGLALVACDDPATPSEVRSHISDDLGSILRETNAAARSASNIPGTAAFDIIDRAFNAQTNDLTPSLRRVAKISTAALGIRAPKSVGIGSDAVVGEPGDDAIDVDALIRTLNEKLFTDANSKGDGVFQVPAELVCNSENGVIDMTCAMQFATADLRVRVLKDDDALRFAVQVDSNHDEPLVFTLRHAHLGITLDLDEAADAMAALVPAFGGKVPNLALAGAVTGSLDILGTARAKIGLSIDRALSIKVADEGKSLDGDDALRLSSAEANVFALTLDAPAKSAALELGLGETKLHAPPTSDDFDTRKSMDLDLPGLTAQVAFTPGQPMSVKHLGLGNRTTTLSVGGTRALSIDLNPDDGRSLDATVTADPAGETLTVSPKLDLRASIDHAALGDDQPVFDVTQVLLAGSLRDRGGDQVEVVDGSFSIATNPDGFGFSAAAGQCVTATEAEDANGSFFTRWTVGACK